MPDYSHESRCHAWGARRVAGVDEVGRGPLAGPVVAAAVVLSPCAVPVGLNDSKALGPALRARLAASIARCADIGLGAASVEEIDALNILEASLLAMRRAVAALPRPPDRLLIDGNRLPAGLPCPAESVVKGDARCLSVAAASIVAKVHRDRIMLTLAQHYSGYGWATNMGYGTAEHLLGLKRHGTTPHHRRSFRPVHNILFQENFESGDVK